MKQILFKKEDYQRIHVAWSDGSKVRHRFMLVPKELFEDSRKMRVPIVIGFCDRFDGRYSILDFSDETENS